MRAGLFFLNFVFSVVFLPALHAQAPPQTALINRDAAMYNEDNQKLYLVDQIHNQIVAISSSDSSQVIPVGSAPIALALNPTTGMLYVVNSGSRNVSVIDTHKDAVVATVPTAARPYAIAVDVSSNRVYVSNTFSNMLTVVDGKTNAAKNLPTGSADVILVGDRQHVYLFGYESDTVTELNPDTGVMTKLSAGAMHLWGAVLDKQTLYISHVQGKSLATIDLATHSIQNFTTGNMPCAIVQSKKTGHLYVANYADGTVSVFGENRKLATIPVSPHPQALTLDEEVGLLYVASPQQNSITAIDTRTNHVRKTYSGLEHPYAVGVNLSNHHAYSINLAENSWTALQPAEAY
ncbi:YncE family protein [Edaphobacter albus]|uniref:YncE family protein n=1 Tax=Edaphobacter sp. 4G125 TaxID=2763071 RepID=UPI001645843B|nr:YncE family protein [Edaphobacter sp. 4G125]QNI37823.1 YncE family protein [Edaphobacter sp. 4G125]